MWMIAVKMEPARMMTAKRHFAAKKATVPARLLSLSRYGYLVLFILTAEKRVTRAQFPQREMLIKQHELKKKGR